jgi:enterochelin esterase-like enzyme
VSRRLLVIATAITLCVAAAWWVFIRSDVDPDAYGVHLVRFEIDSRLVDGPRNEILVIPPGDAPPEGWPVVVFMHGRGSSPEGMLSNQLFAALRDGGGKAPAMLMVDGGEASYFHDRDDGEWGSYVVEEVIPAAAEQAHLDSSRMAIGGISMGGFGALDLGRLYPEEWCGIGAHSPALFESASGTPEGAFDDAEDFAAHDVVGSVKNDPSLYGDTPIWVDVGDEDPFRDIDSSFAESLKEGGADISFKSWPGGHNESYWWSHVDSYLSFYEGALKAC